MVDVYFISSKGRYYYDNIFYIQISPKSDLPTQTLIRNFRICAWAVFVIDRREYVAYITLTTVSVSGEPVMSDPDRDMPDSTAWSVLVTWAGSCASLRISVSQTVKTLRIVFTLLRSSTEISRYIRNCSFGSYLLSSSVSIDCWTHLSL